MPHRDRSNLKEYVGVLHVHTIYSDGSATIAEIVSAAKTAGVSFVIVSDHDKNTAKEKGEDGWRDDVLIIVGVEFSPRRKDAGHALLLGMDRYDCDYDDRNPDCVPTAYLEQFYSEGARVFLAHPDGKQNAFEAHPNHSWNLSSLHAYHGIELWSYIHDWIEGYRHWKLLDYLVNRDKKITGPKKALLKAWDVLCRQRRVAAIGALDTHAYRIPLTPIRIFPYEFEFTTVRTHVFCPELTHEKDADERAILDALVEGACFIAYERFADATGFRFWFETQNGDDVTMGQERTFKHAGALCAVAPRTTDWHLYRNGEIIAGTSDANRIRQEIQQPGVYRVEASLDSKPWIFSNPIYLRGKS